MRVAGNLDLDGQTLKLDQGGNSTTITSNSPGSDITITLPKDADGILVNCEHGGDATKEVVFDSSGATTAKEMTIASSHTDDRTITVPDATDTLVGKATTDTLTNKTLTSPTINTPTLTVNDSALTVQDNSDTSKKLQFQVSGITTSTTRTLTAPDANTTIVGTDATQTLTNKTLTTPTVTVNDNAWTMQDNADTSKKLNLQLSGITTSTTRTLTAPDADTTIVGTDATQTLTNKTLTSPVLTTPTMTAGSNLTLTQQAELRLEDDSGGDYVGLKASASTTTHSYSFPTAQGAADTVLCNNGSGVLSWNGALTTSLTENYVQIGNSSNTATSTDTALQGDILADDVTGLTIKSDVIVNADVNSSAAIAYSKLNLTGAVLSADLSDISGTVVGTTDTQTLTNKVLSDSTTSIANVSDVTKTLGIALGSATTGKATTFNFAHTDNRSITFPDATDTLVGKATTDTLTNKTLTTPVISSISNTGTLTLPTSTDTLVGRATTDTLTNKTVDAPTITNTITYSGNPNHSGATTYTGGAITFNALGEDYDTRIQGDTDAYLLNVNAGLDRVGIGVATPLAKLAIVEDSTSDVGINVLASSAAYAANAIFVSSNTVGGTGFHFLFTQSDTDGTPDTQHRLRGDGEAYADGTWNSGGADYAEYFESANNEALELGSSLVLEGDAVRPYNAISDEPTDIIGIVRPKGNLAIGPAVTGNSGWSKWGKKYLSDKWGRYIMEDFSTVNWVDNEGKNISFHTDRIPEGTVIPETATTMQMEHKRRKLNPEWDKDTVYTERELRDEWILVGLVGQVPVKEDEVVNPRWRKMKPAVNGVEWWFIR